MKKFLLTASMALAIAGGASAELTASPLASEIVTSESVITFVPGVRVTAIPVGEREESLVNRPRKRVSTSEVLVSENFDKWVDGTVESPDYDNPIIPVNYVGELDPDMMNNNAQWYGAGIYSAGGACAVHTDYMSWPAALYTPKGDYSGSVKISLYAKVSPKTGMNGTHLDMNIGNNDDDPFKVTMDGSAANPNSLCSVTMFPQFGWYKIEVEFDNYSAYNDANIAFATRDTMLLDNIEVTSSVDNFIAAPIIKGISDVTETSFTVNFEPVMKANNYYYYLYVLEGNDPDTGEPVYMPIPDPETYAAIKTEGITLEQYWHDSGRLGTPYEYYSIVNHAEPFSCTYTDLDPDTQYYYKVRAHYMTLFSDSEIYPMNELAVPVATEATDITTNSFTANWNRIKKAEKYEVALYGVNKVTADEDNYIILEEDFEKINDYTEKEDIYDPDNVNPYSGLTMDDFTYTPGWSTPVREALLVKGMIGLDYYGETLTTPELYVAGADKITVSIRCEFYSQNTTFYMTFAGQKYEIPVSDGEIAEGEVTLSTNGAETARLEIAGPMYDRMFIDYIVISQPLKEGALTYTYLGSERTMDTFFTFKDLDTETYDMYAYNVVSTVGIGDEAVYSASSDRILVDLKSGTSMSGITAIDKVNGDNEIQEVARYTIDGKLISEPVKGINIVRMSDGSTRKVLEK